MTAPSVIFGHLSCLVHDFAAATIATVSDLLQESSLLLMILLIRHGGIFNFSAVFKMGKLISNAKFLRLFYYFPTNGIKEFETSHSVKTSDGCIMWMYEV